MIVYNLDTIDKEWKAPLQELITMQGNCVGIDGIKLTLEKGSKFSVVLKNDTLRITYTKKCEVFRGIALLGNTLPKNGRLERTQKCRFDRLGLMTDCSRNAVMNVQGVKKLIRYLAMMGYTELQLYTEDTYEVAEEPFFGYLRGRYTKEELKELDTYAQAFGIELVPCIQTLAHLKTIMRWKPYQPIVDCASIILVGEERTYELIENMFKTLSECFTSRRVNIGMDEASMLGLGKYLQKNGYKNRYEIMIFHLNKVLGICKKYGFNPSMWSDMFFRLANAGEYYCPTGKIDEKYVKEVPEEVELIYWDYYSKSKQEYDNMIRAHKQFDNPICFAGGAWKWIGFAPDNRFSLYTSKCALDSCIENGVKDVLLTAWGDNGGECSIFAVLPTIAYYAERAYEQENAFESNFYKYTNCTLEDFLCLDLPNRQLPVQDDVYTNLNNSSKIFFFNDLFLGVFDCIIDKNSSSVYQNNIKKLETARKNCVVFAPLFDTSIALLKVVARKYDLGVKVRQAYQLQDKKNLKMIIKDYKKLQREIEIFYAFFKEQWFMENKPHGFDIQDIRIGGVLRRVQACQRRLQDFCKGKTDKIEELEEEIIDFYLREKCAPKYDALYNFYEETSSINNFS